MNTILSTFKLSAGLYLKFKPINYNNMYIINIKMLTTLTNYNLKVKTIC